MVRYTQAVLPPVEEKINFVAGYPATSSLPISILREASAAQFAEDDLNFLHYGIPAGFLEYRESLARFLTKNYKVEVDPETLVTMSGATGGLDMLLKYFTKPGDTIFTEDPTYFLVYPVFKDYGLKVMEIKMDFDGVNLQEFEEKLKTHTPTAFYTIPISQNPTGRTTSEAKRKRLVELSYAYNFKIFSDEVYQLLSFTEDIPKPFFYYDTVEPRDHVVTIGSFSKILCPAVRVGWLECGAPIRSTLEASGFFRSGGCVNPIMCGILWKALELGLLDTHLKYAKQLLREKSIAMMEALEKHAPKISYEVPCGGYFILARMPDEYDANEFLSECLAFRVAVLPGSTFGAYFSRYFRLAFSFYELPDITEGIRRLGQAVDSLEKKLAEGKLKGSASVPALDIE